MTYRDFLKAIAVFSLLYFLLIATVIAAPKWKDEVGIASWCYDTQTIREIVKAEADGNPEVGNHLARLAFASRSCVRLPVPAAAFRPTGIVEKYPSFSGKPVTLIKGNLIQKDESLGREVYVLVPDSLLSSFQMTEGAMAPLEGPEFGGWQDL